MGVSHVRVQQRAARFGEFVRTHGISSISLSSSQTMTPRFLLYIEGTQEIALVSLVHLRRMYLTAYEGALKTLLYTWSEQENTNLILDIDPDDPERLEVLKVHLPPQSHRHSSASLRGEEMQAMFPSLRLSSADSPLVDLAERLGYSVFLTASQDLPFHPRYCVLNAQASALLAQGDSLVSVLAEVLAPQHAHA